jgi:MATE family multidrug resistance protein
VSAERSGAADRGAKGALQGGASIISQLVKLGWPVLVAQVAVMLYAVTDTIMAGHFGTDDLAAVGIGASIYISVFVTTMGVLLALTPVAAQLHGAGKDALIGEQVRQCAWLGALMSIVVIVILQFPQPFFALTQVEPEVEVKVRAYLRAIQFGVPALLFFRVFGSFSNAISRPRVVMVLNLAGLALKVPLNWVLIEGHLGLPALGGAGCAVATALCSWGTCIAAWIWCARVADYRVFGVFARWSWPDVRSMRHLLAVGVPIGATFLVDVTAFTFMTLFVARLGARYSGAHQIAANVAALAFMVPLSLGNAATVLVGQAIGARAFARARATGIQALVIAMVVAVVFALGLGFGREAIAQFYSRDPAVQVLAASLLAYVAVYHLVDALQAVTVNVLRGYKRTVVPMVVYTVSLWGMGLGGGYVLGLTDWVDLQAVGLATPLGASGFWIAAILSVLCAGGIVTLYWLRESARVVRNPEWL